MANPHNNWLDVPVAGADEWDSTPGSDVPQRPTQSAYYVDVTLRRDPMHTMARRVLAHEVPILQNMHGPASVTVTTRHPGAVQVDPVAEWERLARAYHRAGDDMSWCEATYGAEHLSRLPEAIADIAARMADAEPAASDAPIVNEMTNRELRQQLAALDVDAPANANRTALLALLAQHSEAA